MGDLDLDAIEAAGHRGAVPSQRVTLALAAEVRRLRTVRDAAANLQEFRPDCDDLTGPRGDGPPVTCRQCWPANPEEWCATCELVHTLEEADRG